MARKKLPLTSGDGKRGDSWARANPSQTAARERLQSRSQFRRLIENIRGYAINNASHFRCPSAACLRTSFQIVDALYFLILGSVLSKVSLSSCALFQRRIAAHNVRSIVAHCSFRKLSSE